MIIGVDSVKRYYDLDILKIGACLLVILNHIIFFLNDYLFTNTSALFYSFSYSIYKVAVPIFIMISGALLLKKERNYKYILKKIIRIVIPLIIISYYIAVKENIINYNEIFKFLLLILKDPIKIPYWYLYMLISLYLVTPFLYKMIKNFKDKDYKIFFIIILLIPTILKTLSILTNFNINNYLTINFLSINIGYFIMGYYLYNLKLNKNIMYKFFSLYIISTILMFLSSYVPYLLNNNINLMFDGVDNILVLLSSLSLFYLVRYIYSKIKINDKTKIIISNISDTTFGIYLIHFIIYYMVYYRIIFIYQFNPIIGILVTLFLTFIVSCILVYIFKQSVLFIKKEILFIE